jgi:NAD+ kinase
MTDVVIVAHQERREAGALARAAVTWLEAHGHRVFMPREDAVVLGLETLASDRPAREASLALCIGGDGTVLRMVDMLDGAPVPIMAVNLGMLAYLTEVEPPAMTAALQRYFSGDCTVEHRMLLQVEVVRAGSTQPSGSWRALNEAVLEKEESGHTVRLLVNIDDAPFMSYAADGMIIATPTGSTAYSLSARGPVISPQHRAMLLTPVSPHQLFDRSLVLSPDETVEIEVAGHRGVVLTVDGTSVASLAAGDTVRCRPATEDAEFVCFGRRRFHQVLRAKFGLADR